MEFTKFSTALLADDVRASSAFYIRHFGFRKAAEVADWYVSLHHEDHPGYIIDFVARDHESTPDPFGGRATSGVLFGFVVDDARQAEARFRADGVPIVAELRDEPWGQRHFYVASPEGALIDVVQFVDPDPEWLARQQLGATPE